MAKEPWEEDIYDKGEKELTRSKKTSDVVANRVLTILAVIFFIMVITIVGMMIYLSTGGSSKKVYGGFRHRCHDRDTDRADLRCDETDFLSELPGQIRPDQLVFR